MTDSLHDQLYTEPKSPLGLKLIAALAALAVAAEDLSLAKPGTRDNAVNAQAYRFGRMIARGWICAGLPEDYLFRACERNGLVAENGAAAVTARLSGA